MKSPLGTEWGENVFFFSLARHALLEGLRGIGVGACDCVMLPEFICRELLASVHLLGAETVFYPVDEQLRPLVFPECAGLKAVLAVDYFGFPQDLAPFQKLCDDTGAVLIEDNAHGFLSRDTSGQLLGCRSDLGILSLRKTFPVPDGAALIVKASAGCDPGALGFRTTSLPLGYRIKSGFRQIQRATGIPLKSIGEQIARAARRMRTGNSFPPSSPESERVIPMPPPMHGESFRQLGMQDLSREATRRKRLYMTVEGRLKKCDIQPVFPLLPDGTVPYGFPFRASTASARTAVRLARKMGFDCSPWPELPTAVASSAPDYYKNVYWVNFLC